MNLVAGTHICYSNAFALAVTLLMGYVPFPMVCVRNPPAKLMDTSMTNITAMRGDTVEFRCRVENLGKHMIAFFRDEIPPRLIAFDESIFRQQEKYELKPRVNADEWVLRIKDVQETDIGGYICQLNTNPAISITGHLELKIPPTVSRSSTPSAVEVREGHNVTLSCHAEGNPPPTVVWRRADRQIIRYNGANGYGDSVYKGSDLRLNRVSRKHMSEYVCVASNGIPPDESWTIKLHVLFEPIVLPQAMIVEAPLGSMARLVCNVESWPRPIVTWFLNDVELFDSNRYATEQSVADRYKSVHVLEMKDVGPDQFGKYRCVAANDYGKHFAEIQLIEAPSQSSFASLSEGSGSIAHNVDSESSADDAIHDSDDEDSVDKDYGEDANSFYWMPKIDKNGKTTLTFGPSNKRRSHHASSSDSIPIGGGDGEEPREYGKELANSAERNRHTIDYYGELRHRKNAIDDKSANFDGDISGSSSLRCLPRFLLLLCATFALFTRFLR